MAEYRRRAFAEDLHFHNVDPAIAEHAQQGQTYFKDFSAGEKLWLKFSRNQADLFVEFMEDLASEAAPTRASARKPTKPVSRRGCHIPRRASRRGRD